MLWGSGFGGEIQLKITQSLTLLDISLCIKPGLNTFFSPPPQQVNLFKVTVYYLGGGTKARINYAEVLGQIQNDVLSLEA